MTINVYNYQITPKGADKASILVEHKVRVVNNNKNRSSWTIEETKNPVIFDRKVQTFISMSLSLIKNGQSGTMLSGGNFDFKDNIGTGYSLELKYRENDEAVKEVAKLLREMNFSCILGKGSGNCFLADSQAEDWKRESILEKICNFIDAGLKDSKV